ncbi:hypothetical protein [Egicoccus sp. AB-alg2]|uniref:hypothetical protein n=1 Tax=Egicoccus sp. AB-alg2 TaxID=3242693 RepID=UPI00359EAE09
MGGHPCPLARRRRQVAAQQRRAGVTDGPCPDLQLLQPLLAQRDRLRDLVRGGGGLHGGRRRRRRLHGIFRGDRRQQVPQLLGQTGGVQRLAQPADDPRMPDGLGPHRADHDRQAVRARVRRQCGEHVVGGAVEQGTVGEDPLGQRGPFDDPVDAVGDLDLEAGMAEDQAQQRREVEVVLNRESRPNGPHGRRIVRRQQEAGVAARARLRSRRR